ncbi:MAG: DUF3987 domain-containing protein [Bacteroides sp.]|uniref:DUF3987 domain-containing protein n=1 Tax=Bacteroides sp. TaxID=29523 RepID=UPI002FC87C44
MKQDCGKHDDVFRAAFQYEGVSSDYEIDGRQVMAHHPHLACCFSGTPAQLTNFVYSAREWTVQSSGYLCRR